MPDDAGASWKHRSTSVWGATPAGAGHSPDLTPGTKDFFETARRRRRDRELRFLSEWNPFARAAGQRVLEIGCGAGFDAYEFCRHGADYTGIDITPENVDRARTHLGFHGFHPRVLRGDAELLPFDDGLFDVVFSNGVLHHTPDIQRAFRETRRVLRTGGAFWVVVYHRHSAFFQLKLWLVDHVLCKGYRRESLSERLSRIEYTTSDQRPLVRVYSRRELRTLLSEAGFSIERIWVRKLLREDLPTQFRLWILWRLIPDWLLDRAGRLFGWYLIAEARKPHEP